MTNALITWTKKWKRSHSESNKNCIHFLLDASYLDVVTLAQTQEYTEDDVTQTHLKVNQRVFKMILISTFSSNYVVFSKKH